MADPSFLGFSDAPTPSGTPVGLSALEPFYVLSHDGAGSLSNYNPDPTGDSVLKHIKFYVGNPTETGSPLVNIDSYDLYNYCDQHAKTPSGNGTVAGSAEEGDYGGPIRGRPVRFQKVHFTAGYGNTTQNYREYFAFLPISDPVITSSFSNSEWLENYFSSGVAQWNNREYIKQQDASLDNSISYRERLIIGGRHKFSGNVWVNGIKNTIETNNYNYIECNLTTNGAVSVAAIPTNMPPDKRYYDIRQVAGDIVCF